MNLQHSAKGSTWKDHKYIKKVDGTYYYPKGYKGGKHSDEAGVISMDDFEKYLADKFDEGNEQDKEEYIKKNFDKLLSNQGRAAAKAAGRAVDVSAEDFDDEDEA